MTEHVPEAVEQDLSRLNSALDEVVPPKETANVLIAMPFAIVAFLLVANPSYLARFTESALGYGLVALSVVMLVIGWLWMRKVTRFTF